MAKQSTDSALLVKSIETPEAFGEFFDRYYDEIRAYAWRRIGDSVAEDIAAETFARAFAGRGKYDVDHESARPWLYGIATNLIRMHARREKRRLRAHANTLSGPTEDFADGAADRASAEGRRGELLHGLMRLGRRDREIVLLISWAELSSKEVGIALGLPDATVRTRLARARKKLAQGMTTTSSLPAMSPLLTDTKGVE